MFFYVLCVIIFTISLIYLRKNKHKFGDEDYASEWYKIMLSLLICLCLGVPLLIVGLYWLYQHFSYTS